MRNRVLSFVLVSISFISAFADTTSVAGDSANKPFIPPDQGPLGIDNVTGVALYGAAILFAVLVLALWRSNIMKRRSNNG